MNRTTQRTRSSFYRSGGMPRVASMIAMLVVVGMLISRSADPKSWVWLVREGKAPAEPGSAIQPARQEPRPPDPVAAPGATDTDSEERSAAVEQFQALTDRTTELAREEMPAYWRLFGWAEHQSLGELEQRADKTAVLNQFIQSPEEQRGKLFQLELNVRRVLSYDAPANSAGIKKVYEVWGWTTESKAWLYVVLTAHLPPGMPVGPDVNERATFAGYFLKVQGYHAAGAGPRDKPLVAPLLIGRLDWSTPPAAASASADASWPLWLTIFAVLLIASGAAIWLLLRRKTGARRAAMKIGNQVAPGADLRGWLASAERGSIDDAQPQTRFHDN